MEFRDGPLRIAEVWHNGAQRGATRNTMELYSESHITIVVTLTDALHSEVWCAGFRLSVHGAHGSHSCKLMNIFGWTLTLLIMLGCASM